MDTSADKIYRRLSDLFKEAGDLLRCMGFSKHPHQEYESCPFCHLTLEDYIKTIPQDKYISIDIPLDGLEFEKVSSMVKFVNVFNRAVWEYNNGSSRIKLKYLNRHMVWVDSVDDLNISGDK